MPTSLTSSLPARSCCEAYPGCATCCTLSSSYTSGPCQGANRTPGSLKVPTVTVPVGTTTASSHLAPSTATGAMLSSISVPIESTPKYRTLAVITKDQYRFCYVGNCVVELRADRRIVAMWKAQRGTDPWWRRPNTQCERATRRALRSTAFMEGGSPGPPHLPPGVTDRPAPAPAPAEPSRIATGAQGRLDSNRHSFTLLDQPAAATDQPVETVERHQDRSQGRLGRTSRASPGPPRTTSSIRLDSRWSPRFAQ